jgi:Tat protein secretion system quality control protein TatD with DNase activity
LSIALYGTETWTLWEVDQKHMEGFEMRCWRRMEKINLTDHVKNEVVLHTVKAERNTLHTIKKRWKANWIGHVFCRNCLLEQLLKER